MRGTAKTRMEFIIDKEEVNYLTERQEERVLIEAKDMLKRNKGSFVQMSTYIEIEEAETDYPVATINTIIDVEKFTRCKQCIYWRGQLAYYPKEVEWAVCGNEKMNNIKTDPNFYCAYAKVR